MKKLLSAVLITLIAVFTINCATSTDADLDAARHALDTGDWQTAINSAGNALSSNPANVEAALLLSSGYAGAAGITILTVSADISDATEADSKFKVAHDAVIDAIHDALVQSDLSLAELRNGVVTLSTTLTPQPDATHDRYSDQQYQLGILEVIEAFGTPSVTAQPEQDGPIITADITVTMSENVQDDFIGADEHLINAGMDADSDLVVNIRRTYCVLKNASAAATGFDLSALQDINLCQLTPSPAREALGPGDFQTPTITSCADFDFSVCPGTTPTAL